MDPRPAIVHTPSAWRRRSHRTFDIGSRLATIKLHMSASDAWRHRDTAVPLPSLLRLSRPGSLDSRAAAAKEAVQVIDITTMPNQQQQQPQRCKILISLVSCETRAPWQCDGLDDGDGVLQKSPEQGGWLCWYVLVRAGACWCVLVLASKAAIGVATPKCYRAGGRTRVAQVTSWPGLESALQIPRLWMAQGQCLRLCLRLSVSLSFV